jgi:hypothetical protein
MINGVLFTSKMRRYLLILIITLLTVKSHSQSFNSYSVKQDTCLDRKFSVVFYVILDSSYTPGLATPIVLQNAIDSLNSTFQRICVSFQNCTTIYIPFYKFNGWYYDVTDRVVTANWYTENVINIYLADTVYPVLNPEAEGYTFLPTVANLNAPKKDMIAIDKNKLLINKAAVLKHLMGHFFGLPHTHDEINPGTPAVPPPPLGVISHEFANGTQPNCSTHGDGFCDTEADPQVGPIIDGMGTYYVPPLDNLMSYYTSTLNKFTAMQYYHMAYTIITKRLYLK